MWRCKFLEEKNLWEVFLEKIVLTNHIIANPKGCTVNDYQLICNLYYEDFSKIEILQ